MSLPTKRRKGPGSSIVKESKAGETDVSCRKIRDEILLSSLDDEDEEAGEGDLFGSLQKWKI